MYVTASEDMKQCYFFCGGTDALGKNLEAGTENWKQ